MQIEKPSRELSVGEIISQSFRLYLAKFFLFFPPFLVAGLITGIVSSAVLWHMPLPSPPSRDASLTMVTQWFWSFISTLITMAVLVGTVSVVINSITMGMVVKCTSDILEKNSSSLKEGFYFAASKFVPLLGASIITSILIIVGLFLLYVPGIILMIMFSLVEPSIIIEQKGVFESLGRSRKLVSHRWGKTFILLLILGLILIAVSWITTTITAPFGTTRFLIPSVVTSFVTPIFPIVTTLLYYSMVAREALQLPPPPPPF